MKDITKEYGLQNLYKIAQDAERVIFTPAPSLKSLYNHDTGPQLVEIIESLVKHLEDFTGARQKLQPAQRKALANVIICRHSNMYITHFHLFILLCMAGEFGKFFDRLDPMDITTALHDYVNRWIPTYVREHWYNRGIYNREGGEYEQR